MHGGAGTTDTDAGPLAGPKEKIFKYFTAQRILSAFLVLDTDVVVDEN